MIRKLYFEIYTHNIILDRGNINSLYAAHLLRHFFIIKHKKIKQTTKHTVETIKTKT